MTRDGIPILAVVSGVGVLLCIASFAIGELAGAGDARKGSEEALKACRTDLDDSRKQALDSWNKEMEWASLVGKFADQQRVTVELVEQKLGITPEMIVTAVAKDKAEKNKADAGIP